MKSSRVLVAMMTWTIVATATPSCKSKRAALEGLSPSLASGDGQLALADKDSTDLFTVMRAKEEEAGVKTPAGVLHNTDGVIYCTRMIQGGAVPCYLAVRVNNNYTERQPLPPALAANVWSFVRGHEKLIAEPIVMADALCSYMGKSTPPYEIEESKCKLQYPRLPNEAIIAGKEAQELASKLQGNAQFTADTPPPSGSLLCYKKTNAEKNEECVLRTLKDGVLQEAFIVVSDETSRLLYRGNEKTARFLHEINRPVGSKTAFVPLAEYLSQVTCVIDMEKLKTMSLNYAICKLSL